MTHICSCCMNHFLGNKIAPYKITRKPIIEFPSDYWFCYKNFQLDNVLWQAVKNGLLLSISKKLKLQIDSGGLVNYQIGSFGGGVNY